ncbi:hypothetical protein D5086_003090 [Populus alba]|uniref:Uncharacterized protein n=1 Tax=Populus alba TaxID=43335 RepID=A0ACC4D4I4_POPAL
MENQHDDNCCLFTPSIITLTVSAVLIAITRILYILCQSGKPLRPSKSQKPLSTLIVLGSGGHTAEMINVLNVLLQKDRFYAMGPGTCVPLLCNFILVQDTGGYKSPIQHFMVLAAKNRSKEAYANNRSWEQARNEQELPSIYSLCPCWSTFFPIV